jgi:septal ring factor EnvC (AmiA/AmiB activator)
MTARNTRPAPLDSDHMPLEGKRLMKFDPTINTGTIIQIATVVVLAVAGFSAVKTELATQKVEIEANKLSAQSDIGQTARALAELKSDVKEQAKTLGDIKESLAILRGRASDTGSRK